MDKITFEQLPQAVGRGVGQGHAAKRQMLACLG